MRAVADGKCPLHPAAGGSPARSNHRHAAVLPSMVARTVRISTLCLSNSRSTSDGAILTTAANAAMRVLHQRMPVILERDDWHAWLDGGDGLLRPAA